MKTFQDLIQALSSFWAKEGCLILTPYDVEKGAGTSNPITFLRSLGPEPFKAAHFEPCRRPKDGRYGENPNRFQHYFQYQVLLKPSPDDILEKYLDSLRAIGIEPENHDIRFVHDDWENPTLGAWGLGWEVWLDGMEVTQFTYFQQVAGIPLSPITGEITYGLERLAMCLQKKDSSLQIMWNDQVSYHDLYYLNEVQWSTYNFEAQDDAMWMRHFEDFSKEAKRLIALDLPIPAYDFVIKSSHAFNLLDAKGVISVSERASYIGRIRELAKGVAEKWLSLRERIGYPLLQYWKEKKTLEKPVSEEKRPSQEKECFVFEIGCEELPAAFLPTGLENIERGMKSLLQKEGLSFSSVKAMGTPRRLSVVVHDLVTKKASELIEKKGPKASLFFDTSGNPSQIGKGFLLSLNLQECTKQECTKEEVEKGSIKGLELRTIKDTEYLFHVYKTEEKSTTEILQKALPSFISSLEFPKTMRWGKHTLSFARPIKWILALLGENVIPFTLEHLSSGRTTYGHRFLSPKPISLEKASLYETTLEQAYVLVDPKKREEKIERELSLIEQKFASTTTQKKRVLNEVIHLVEWPITTTASFDPAFLQAPKEVLISEMIGHQKYFPLMKEGTLSNTFAFVANIPPTDVIRNGNVKVLSARLSDGTFLWKEDLATPLSTLREKLKNIVYYKELGSLFQKTDRLKKGVEFLHQAISRGNLDMAKEGARFSKADIASSVVGEFPELQGTIGSLIAKGQGLPYEVQEAIRESWLPKQEQGELPKTQEGVLVALADKFDTLVGFFALSLEPSSSSDPFALRRQAVGIIRILLDQKINLSLRNTFSFMLDQFNSSILKASKEAIIQNLLSFMAARAKAYLLDTFKKEIVEAVFHVQSDDIYDAYLRIHAYTTFKDSNESFVKFIEVLKRAIGQVDLSFVQDLEPAFLIDESEKNLYATLQQVQEQAKTAQEKHDWTTLLLALTKLQKPIDDLFSKVKVLDDDLRLRKNRLSLLRMVIGLFSDFATIEKLKG